MSKFFAGLIFLCACHSAPQLKPPPESQIPGYWLQVFPPFPRAKFICSQHVAGSPVHIVWSLYATATSLPEVHAFYAQQAQARSLSQPSASEYLWQASGGRTLHIMDISALRPDCGKKLTPAMQTVFIVSQATRRE